MGRRKLKLEFIEKQKSRLLTLKNRKEGLKKKLHQLTTLCDVPACMIIRNPTTDSISIWPEDSAQVRRLIDSYNLAGGFRPSPPPNRLLQGRPGAVKTYRVSDFFNERAEGELAKLQKKDLETELSTWDDRLHLMDESQLRELVRSREAMIKKEKESSEMLYLGEFEEIVDQDRIFSIGDGMAGISAHDQLPVSEFYCPPPLNLPQSLMENNVMLGLEKFAGYYCPPPLETFMGHSYLNQGYCSSMDVNQRVQIGGIER